MCASLSTELQSLNGCETVLSLETKEVRVDAHGASDHLDLHVAPQDLLRQHAQLHVRQTLALLQLRVLETLLPFRTTVED